MLISGLSLLHHCFVLWFLFLSGFWENVKSLCYLLPCPAQEICSQGMSVGVGGWDAVVSGEGRLVQEMWALGRDLLQCWEERAFRRFVVSLPCFLVGVAYQILFLYVYFFVHVFKIFCFFCYLFIFKFWYAYLVLFA